MFLKEQIKDIIIIKDVTTHLHLPGARHRAWLPMSGPSLQPAATVCPEQIQLPIAEQNFFYDTSLDIDVDRQCSSFGRRESDFALQRLVESRVFDTERVRLVALP